MYRIHTFADTSFAAAACGARVSVRAQFGFADIHISGAPTPLTQPSAPPDPAQQAEDVDAAESISRDLQSRAAGAGAGSSDPQRVLDAITAVGVFTTSGQQALWQLNSDATVGSQRLRDAAYSELQHDLTAFNGASGAAAPSLQDLFATMSDPSSGRMATDEVIRRYAAGRQVRSDLQIVEALEDDKLSKSKTDADRGASSAALTAVRAQAKTLDANLDAIEQQLQVTGHTAAIEPLAASASDATGTFSTDKLGEDGTGIFLTMPAAGTLEDVAAQLSSTGKPDPQVLAGLQAFVQQQGGSSRVPAGKIYLPQELLQQLAQVSQAGAEPSEQLVGDVAWLNRWLPADSGWTKTQDVDQLWKTFGSDSGDAGPNKVIELLGKLPADQGGDDARRVFERMVLGLYRQHGVDPSEFEQAFSQLDQQLTKGTTPDPTAHLDYERLNKVAQALVDAKGDLYVGDGSGRPRYTDNDGGKVTNVLVDFLSKHAKDRGGFDAAVLALANSIDFAGSDASAQEQTAAKQQFVRDTYAAYGAKLPS